MKPSEIIDRVKGKFDVLYYDDSYKLESMMKDTLGVYEDRAGSVRSAQIASPGTSVATPPDFLAVATVSDANGLFVDHSVVESAIQISAPTLYPVTVQYLFNFRDMSLDDELPKGSIGLISRHFEAELAIRNTRRERNVALAAGLHRELPSDEELTARRDAVELAMEENAEIIPMATVM